MGLANAWRRLAAIRVVKVVAVAFLLGVSPYGAHSSDNPTSAPKGAIIKIDELSSVEVGRLIRNLIAAKRHEDARSVVRQWRPQTAGHKERVIFTDAMIASHRGNYQKSIALYRKVLDADPDNDNARFAMAQVMAAIGDVDGLKSQTRFLVQSGFDDNLDGAVTKLLERTRNAAPLQMRFYGSLLPSSNINNGTDRSTIYIGGIPLTIDEQLQRKSGIGLLGGMEVSYRHALTSNISFISSARGVLRHYPSIDATQLTADGSLGFARHIGITGVSAAFTVSSNHNASQFVDLSYGIRLEVHHRFNKHWSGYIAPYARREENFINDNYDGWSAGFHSHVDYAFGRNHFLRGIGNAKNRETQLDRFSYTDLEIGLGYNRPLPLNVNAYVQINAATRHYDGVYPGLNEGQEDFRWGGKVAFTKTDFRLMGLAPRVEYKFERLQSNAAFSDRTTHGFDIRLTKSF
ncbi:MAG: porin family protein [Pseudomonadota bacterium]